MIVLCQLLTHGLLSVAEQPLEQLIRRIVTGSDRHGLAYRRIPMLGELHPEGGWQATVEGE